jgi:hypothetical protein
VAYGVWTTPVASYSTVDVAPHSTLNLSRSVHNHKAHLALLCLQLRTSENLKWAYGNPSLLCGAQSAPDLGTQFHPYEARGNDWRVGVCGVGKKQCHVIPRGAAWYYVCRYFLRYSIVQVPHLIFIPVDHQTAVSIFVLCCQPPQQESVLVPYVVRTVCGYAAAYSDRKWCQYTAVVRSPINVPVRRGHGAVPPGFRKLCTPEYSESQTPHRHYHHGVVSVLTSRKLISPAVTCATSMLR